MTLKLTRICAVLFGLVAVAGVTPAYGTVMATVGMGGADVCSQTVYDSAAATAYCAVNQLSIRSRADMPAGVLSVEFGGATKFGSSSYVFLQGSAELDGTVVVKNSPPLSYLQVIPIISGSISETCGFNGCIAVGGTAEIAEYLTVLNTGRQLTLSHLVFSGSDNSFAFTINPIGSAVLIPLSDGSRSGNTVSLHVKQTLSASAAALIWPNTQTAIDAHIYDPLQLVVVDANGNQVPDAVIQTDFGTASSVPEPRTVFLLGAGVATMASFRRRLHY